MILGKVRDPRLITIRRGGTLTDADHHRLAIWAADCADHVLHHFENVRPDDDRSVVSATICAGRSLGNAGVSSVPDQRRTRCIR